MIFTLDTNISVEVENQNAPVKDILSEAIKPTCGCHVGLVPPGVHCILLFPPDRTGGEERRKEGKENKETEGSDGVGAEKQRGPYVLS